MHRIKRHKINKSLSRSLARFVFHLLELFLVRGDFVFFRLWFQPVSMLCQFNLIEYLFDIYSFIFLNENKKNKLFNSHLALWWIQTFGFYQLKFDGLFNFFVARKNRTAHSTALAFDVFRWTGCFVKCSRDRK